DECAASFDERFGLAMRVVASLPLPPDQDVENPPADAPPKATVSNRHVRPDQDVENRRADAPPKANVSNLHVRVPQPRTELAQHCKEAPQQAKKVPRLEDDGRTAIYDITARTVYLPSGRRLEAHSGFGDLMDNPRHVHVRMQGATPPNVYNLTLRERLFHGV